MKRWPFWLACLCAVSCNTGPDSGPPPYPTSGRVLVNGQPAGGIVVAFVPMHSISDRSVVGHAVADAEGRFSLSTYAMNDGVPAGEYYVTLRWPLTRSVQSPDRLGGKFASAETSGLRSTITKGRNELKAFEISATLEESKSGKRTIRKGVHESTIAEP